MREREATPHLQRLEVWTGSLAGLELETWTLYLPSSPRAALVASQVTSFPSS